MRNVGSLTGKFNSWTVLEYAGNSKYRCQCDCGTIKILQGTMIKKGHSKHCRNCQNESAKMNGILSDTIWNKFIAGAKKRKIEFTISKEYSKSLLIAQNYKCNLSGLDLVFAKTSLEHSHGNTNASLDRIDSSKGYIEGNVQWVHKDINRMKSNFNEQYFRTLCQKVEQYSPLDLSSIRQLEFRKNVKVNARTKLTDDQVIEIRKLASQGLSNKEISTRFNVTPGNISYIVTGQSRKNVC